MSLNFLTLERMWPLKGWEGRLKSKYSTGISVENINIPSVTQNLTNGFH